jgi:hypothetical protein
MVNEITGRERGSQPAATVLPTVRFSPATIVEFTTAANTVLASATALSGQQTSQAPIFRGGTTLVRVDVTVLDAAGKPVPGLTPDDFEITLDGRAQRVQTVDYQTTPTSPAVNATSERQATNSTPASPSRLVVMLVDDLSMAATTNRDLVYAASRFVANLQKADLIGFTTTSGEATVNPRAITRPLRLVSGTPWVNSQISEVCHQTWSLA